MFAAAAALATLSASCGGGGGGGGGGTASGTVSGNATYDRVAATDAGLDYGAAQPRPIRGAVVRVVDPGNNATVAQGTTDDLGNFSIAYSRAPAQVAVLVLAQTASPPLVVRDNTDGATWTVRSAPFAAEGTRTVNVRAGSGWTGIAYDPAARAAAPFAILDSMLTAARAFLAPRPALQFPALTLNWSPENVPDLNPTTNNVDYPRGLIGTSHWNGTELFILGAQDIDTDEFDDHVIVHEWSHYYEATLSRSDSPGGQHAVGELKDPRLAWGEGWGNGVSAIALADPVYRDTVGGRQSTTGIRDDFESNATGGGSRDPSPGWWSEASIARLLVDLADAANDDPANVGLGPIHDAMTTFQKNTPALTTVFSFVSGLKRVAGVNTAQVDQVVAARGIQATPIAADASGEFAAGVLRQAPATTAGSALYEPPPAGVGTTTLAGDDFNDLDQNRYYRIDGNGLTRIVTVSNVPDVDIHVYQNGQIIQRAEAFPPPNGPTQEQVSFPTTAGQTYVVVVTGFQGSGPAYDVGVIIQ
jgi:hypothetical protein